MRILHESNKQWLVWSQTSSKVWKEFKLKMEIPCQARYSECGTGTNSGLFSGRRMEHPEQPKQRVHASKPWSNSENILRHFIGQQW